MFVTSDSLDIAFSENHEYQEVLHSYKSTLEAENLKVRALEGKLRSIAERLSRLGEWIDQGTFEEKRLAIEQLVKNILASYETIDGKHVPVVTITYRFNKPSPIKLPGNLPIVAEHTHGRAATMG